jgi:hypothetical protein
MSDKHNLFCRRVNLSSFFKKLFLKGAEKLGKDKTVLSLLNSVGILAEVKII